MNNRVPTAHDLRGAARLAIDATRGLTDLVEAMHERIARPPGMAPGSAEGRTGGITGLVYKTIRGVTHVVGGSVDALLGAVARSLDAAAVPASSAEPTPPSAQREAIVAALNGVLGDHLEASANPLAITMSLRQGGRSIDVSSDAAIASVPEPKSQVLVMIHGLCMNDLQCTRDGHNHGLALAQQLGFTPLFLHYNSGRHVSDNGQSLATLMQQLADRWPVPLQRVVLLGHSMGGLVARSALHQAAEAGQRWPALVTDLLFLGTPHHGAPLERAGHGVDLLLGATPYAAPLARLGQVRSAGITDLRHGHLLREDWAGHDRFAHRADDRRHVPLPATARVFAVASRLAARPGAVKDRFVGDGLVPLKSALGMHADPARCLDIPAQRQWVGDGIGHLDLLSNAGVMECLQRWLAKSA